MECDQFDGILVMWYVMLWSVFVLFVCACFFFFFLCVMLLSLVLLLVLSGAVFHIFRKCIVLFTCRSAFFADDAINLSTCAYDSYAHSDKLIASSANNSALQVNTT